MTAGTPVTLWGSDAVMVAWRPPEGNAFALGFFTALKPLSGYFSCPSDKPGKIYVLVKLLCRRIPAGYLHHRNFFTNETSQAHAADDGLGKILCFDQEQ